MNDHFMLHNMPQCERYFSFNANCNKGSHCALCSHLKSQKCERMSVTTITVYLLYGSVPNIFKAHSDLRNLLRFLQQIDLFLINCIFRIRNSMQPFIAFYAAHLNGTLCTLYIRTLGRLDSQASSHSTYEHRYATPWAVRSIIGYNYSFSAQA